MNLVGSHNDWCADNFVHVIFHNDDREYMAIHSGDTPLQAYLLVYCACFYFFYTTPPNITVGATNNCTTTTQEDINNRPINHRSHKAVYKNGDKPPECTSYNVVALSFNITRTQHIA